MVQSTPLHKAFNAFERELVLIAKKCCGTKHVAALKKRFRLFDIESSSYASAFIASVEIATSTRPNDISEVLICSGVRFGDIRDAAGGSTEHECLVLGMLLYANLINDCAGNEIAKAVACALVERKPEKVVNVVLDEDLLEMIEKLCALKLPERVIAVLEKMCSVGGGGGDLGIIELAKDISRNMDMSTLLDPSSGGADMSGLFATINAKVQQRMRDGSVNPDKLCQEAQSILGEFSSLNV